MPAIDYLGSSITQDDAWYLEIAKIPHSLRDEEAELMKSRWFDYRHMLPAQATYLFVHAYNEMYREVHAKIRDYREAVTAASLITEDIFEGKDLLSMWRARQEADRIGCKYNFYLRFAFNRGLERGWAYIPRPNQLFAETLALDIKDAWADERMYSLQLATNLRFVVDCYVGHPDQDAYHLYLIAEAKKREHPHMILARLIFQEGILPYEIAGQHFGVDVLLRAKRFAAARKSLMN